MSSTVTPEPNDEPQKAVPIVPEHLQAILDAFPDATLDGGSINLTKKYQDHVDSLVGTNGRLIGDSWGYDIPAPPKPDPVVYKNWQDRVRANARIKYAKVKGIPDRIKMLPNQIKAYLKYRIHDYLIGWVLDVNRDPNVKFPFDKEEKFKEQGFLLFGDLDKR